MTTFLELEYHGGGFAGWARQPGERTVQEEVERALATVLREESVPLTVAGRTDRGRPRVGPGRLLRARGGGSVAPERAAGDDVAILASTPAADGSDARTGALSRTYCYRLLNRRARSAWLADRALWWPRAIDREALRACAALLPGCARFTAFTPKDTSHTRFTRDVLRAEWGEDGDLLELWITADSFMRHMNRVLVGTMLEVALGNRTFESFAALLDGAPRSAAGPTAPPHGLALASVAYPSRT